MRKIGNIPRVLKIENVDGLNVEVLFNNNERRVIDFNDVFDQFKIKKNSPISKLRSPSSFSKVQIANNTLSWNNVDQFILFNNEKKKIPFEIGADVLYKMSTPVDEEPGIGHFLKKARISAGLTQDEIAARSGTTRTYISKIENDRSGIELGTLSKIVRAGLGMDLVIKIGSSIVSESSHHFQKHVVPKSNVPKYFARENIGVGKSAKKSGVVTNRKK